jgi:ABC-type transport system substrate-binding protein
MDKLEYPKFVREFSAIVETSLNTADIMKLSSIMLRDFDIVQNTIPDENYETDLSGYTDSDGVWYWHYDLDAAAERLHSIIYGDDE